MSFKAVNWSPNEILGAAKTDQMSNNAEWLYNRTPRSLYTLPGGLRREQGVRIVAGRVQIAQRLKTDTASVRVRFGNYFSTRCQPLITTGIVSGHQPRIHAVINGIGQLQPDHRGFNVQVNINADKKKNDHIARAFWINYMAIGY